MIEVCILLQATMVREYKILEYINDTISGEESDLKGKLKIRKVATSARSWISRSNCCLVKVWSLLHGQCASF